jgi:lambda repressor-like predicted transcriptional regulator
MKPIQIKILMMRAGVSQADISRKLGVSRSFVNQVICGLRSTRRVRRAIASSVGKSVRKLWPSGPSRKAA